MYNASFYPTPPEVAAAMLRRLDRATVEKLKFHITRLVARGFAYISKDRTTSISATCLLNICNKTRVVQAYFAVNHANVPQQSAP